MSGLELALVIALLVLVGLGAAGFGIWLAVKQIRRKHTDAGAKGRPDPTGQRQIVDIPVMQITRLFPGQSLAGFGRVQGVASMSIHPGGLEYRMLRKTYVPFAVITPVDAPSSGRPYRTVWFQGQATGLGVLVAAEVALRQALWHLSRTSPLTDRARARIAGCTSLRLRRTVTDARRVGEAGRTSSARVRPGSRAVVIRSGHTAEVRRWRSEWAKASRSGLLLPRTPSSCR